MTQAKALFYCDVMRVEPASCDRKVAGSACRGVLGQDTEAQTPPDVFFEQPFL